MTRVTHEVNLTMPLKQSKPLLVLCFLVLGYKDLSEEKELCDLQLSAVLLTLRHASAAV